MVTDCAYGFGNTGVGCINPFSAFKKIIMVPYFDSTGAVNTIATATPLNSSFFTGLINQTDPSKRWFPLPLMKNPKRERAADQVETFDDNSTDFVQQGVAKFEGIILWSDGASPQLASKIISGRNLPMGFYAVDKNGQLIGSRDLTTTTNLNPIRIDTGSISAVFNPGDDGKQNQRIMFSFNVHSFESDTQLAGILPSEMAIDVRTLTGLKDVTATYSAINTSTSPKTFTVALKTIYGSMINPAPVTGLVAADFAVYDVTTAAAKTITSATENLDATTGRPTGVYVFVLSATTTAADILRLTPTKNGFDFSLVVTNTFASV